MQGHTPATPVVNSAEADIAASYHAFLRDNQHLAQSSHAQLTEAHHAHGLTFRGRLLCNVLRPRFLSQSRLDELQRISETLADLFERAGSFLLSSDRLLDLVGASEDEREIWSIDPGYAGHTTTSRLDSFMVGDEPMFVEYNAESPASIGYCDVLSEIFTDLPAMSAWAEHLTIERFHARAHLYQSVMKAFESWGGVQPTMAIVDWEDVATRRDFELCADYFEQQGVPTLISDPRRFEYRGGTLFLGDRAINLIYRRVLLHELLARKEEAGPLLDAYRDGAVCMVNNPRSKLLHKKAIFALLSDRSLGLDMSDDEWNIVRTTIPWTRRLSAGSTFYRGEDADLLGLLITNQDRFVLKPVDDYGGRNVLLGWDTDSSQWERALYGALNESYVVQERVATPDAEFPMIRDGKLVFERLLVDTNPLLFNGRLGGLLTRISGSALLNVTAGAGSTTPTFVVKEGDG